MTHTRPPQAPVRSTARELLSGTGWTTLAQLLPLIVNLGMTPYFIHGLGDDRYGVFLVVNSVALMLAQFDGGLGEASMRFFAVNAGRGDKGASTRVITSVALVFLIVVCVAVLVAVFLAGQIIGFFKVAPRFIPEATFLLQVLLALFAVIMIRNLFNALLIAHGRFMFTSLAIIGGYVVYVTGMVLSIERGWGLWGVAWTFIVQQVVGTLISVPASLRHLDRSAIGLMPRDQARQFVRYAWKVQLTGLITVIGTQKDQLVAARVLSAQQSGPYGQGSNFANQLKMMPTNAMGPIQSVMGRLVGSLGAADAAPRIERIQRAWVAGVAGWLAVGLPASYYGVRAWLPDGYAVAAEVAPILFVGGCVSLMVSVQNLWCLTLGHPELLLRASIAGLSVNLSLSALLLRPLGVIGVVVATAGGNIAAALWVIYRSRARLRVVLEPPFVGIPWGWALLAGVLTAAVEYLASGVVPRRGPGLIACGALAVPGAALFSVGVFGLDTVRRTLARVLRRGQMAA